jgi:hypothetical protein
LAIVINRSFVTRFRRALGFDQREDGIWRVLWNLMLFGGRDPSNASIDEAKRINAACMFVQNAGN